jgi:prepilin-type N-terminal cleavage/methylation domain-containing protein
MKCRPEPAPRHATASVRLGARSAAPGFTLLELAVVIFIMGLMLTLAMPYLGGFRQAALKSQARRLAGRATYLYDEATGHKLVLRLIFDLDNNGYAVAQLDPYAIKPVFAPDTSMSGHPVMMPSAIRIRDVTVEGIGTLNRGTIATTFYPEGYVDATVVHLEDASGDVMTLELSPLTGQVAIINGDVMPTGMRLSN